MIKDFFERIWLATFAYPHFRRLNYYLLNLTQKSIGINNYKSERTSGELFWVRYVLNIFKPKTIFDIGAHKGDYTKLFHENGYAEKIYLFEPHPQTFTTLKKQISENENVMIFNIGFSNRSGSSLIFDYNKDNAESGSSHASLYSEVITDLHGTSNVSEVVVQLTTLDSFVKENNIDRISLLKIDTEGNEYPILEGAKKLLEEGRIDLLQFEFGEMNVVSRHFFKDFYDLLTPMYNLYRLLPNGLLPIENYNARQHEIFIYQNIVGIKKDLSFS